MSLIAKSVRGLQKMDATGEKMKKIVMKEGIKKDIKGKIIQVTNANGDAFERNETAIAIDNGAEIKILGFKEDQGKIKAIYDKGMFASGIDIDRLKKGKQEIMPGVNLGSVRERLKELIRKEIAGAYGGDALNVETGDSYTNELIRFYDDDGNPIQDEEGKPGVVVKSQKKR